MARALAFLLIAPLLLAGCFGNGTPETKPDATTATEAAAPWWTVGESWTIEFKRIGDTTRTSTLVVFANGTIGSGGDLPHFWLGVRDRNEALSHVFFDDNIFLGRIHWEYLAPHEKGRHSDMYSWPLTDGKKFEAHAFDRDWKNVVATANADGSFSMQGKASDGATLTYDYVPAFKWFSKLTVTRADGTVELDAKVKDHKPSGVRGTFYFLRGRDYLDVDNTWRTGSEVPFTVNPNDDPTSLAFLLNVQAGPGSRIEFVAPDGRTFHQETLLQGGTRDKVIEIPGKPPQGDGWKLKFIGDVKGSIKVRGIVEYKGTT